MSALVVVGLLDATIATALYTRGWGRSFNLDASRTVGEFVTAPSWSAVFRQDRFNNHPLFSALDHLVYLLTGSDAEPVLRLAPIVSGAAVVALLGVAVASRFGKAAGHVAALTLAVNPLTLRQFREVRGYALVSLGALASTLILLRLVGTEGATQDGSTPAVSGLGRRRALWVLAYAASMTVAVGVHLFALALVPLHALLVSARGGRLRSWGAWCGPAVAIGLAVQLPGIVDGLTAPPRRIFDAGFPLALGANLFGGLALPGVLPLAAVGWLELRTRRWARWCAGCVVALAGASWLAAPEWLDSRFFIWLVPAVAVGTGVAVARWPRLVALAALALGVQLAVMGPTLGTSELPNRSAAELVRAARSDGEAVCALGQTGASLLPYVGKVLTVLDGRQLATCDLVVEADGPSPDPLVKLACLQFTYAMSLPALRPGAAFVDRPPPMAKSHLGRWAPSATTAPCRR